MVIFIFYIIFNLSVVESRVFCQDSNARKWNAMGYSCPITCHNIITAIENLRLFDYNQAIGAHGQNDTIIDNGLEPEVLKTIEIKKNSQNNTRRYQRSLIYTKMEIVEQFKRIVINRTFTKELSYFKLKTIDSQCPEVPSKGNGRLAKWQPKKKCFRRWQMDSNEEFFIITFTKLLNKYASSDIQFTPEMTAILLEKILGTKIDPLRNFNIKDVLLYLKKSIVLFKTRIKMGENYVIKLKSKHCLSVRIAGCLCADGYVENEGQCVGAADCVRAPLADYLARIRLLD